MQQTAAIWDEVEFAKLESGVDEIHSAVLGPSTRKTFAGRTLATRSAAQSLLLDVVRASIATKAYIVTIDEKETGLRNLVNFGHTIGHAIEAVMTPEVLHGECVSVGMILEAEVARSMGILGNAAVGRLARCLKAHGLPTSVHEPLFANCPKSANLKIDTLLDIMRVDKKNAGNVKKIVILSQIGKTYEERATGVKDDIIAKVLSESLRVLPGPPARSTFSLATPGSKSISNRALVLAALGNGDCRLGNLLHSDDTQVMMSALGEMKGADFSWEDNGETLVVRGGGGKLTVRSPSTMLPVLHLTFLLQPPSANKELYLGNAGTASRFLATVCVLVQPEGGRNHTVITGNGRMKERPIGPLVDALTANGTSIKYLGSNGCLPLHIEATASGFKGGRIQLAASVSSQYVSSILLCAPYAAEEVLLELTGGIVISQPYIDLTIAMMATFGIDVERQIIDGKLSNSYQIPRGTYVNPASYNIESDASSATYPLAIAAITGTTCTIQNIGSSSLQGDARFARDVLEPMGCTVVQTATETTVTGPPVGQLRALGFVDMEPMTDAFLTAAVLAAVATLPPLPGRSQDPTQPTKSTRIGGIANQRVKECNRIEAMRVQLARFGVETNELADGIEILGIRPEELKAGPLVHCYDDHRVAMAFSVLATVPGGRGAIIEEKRCVEKTWPSWWDDLTTRIGIVSEGVELDQSSTASTSALPRHAGDASIFLLGMRGAGKTHVGKVGAAALGWPVIDADAMFETVLGITAKDYVNANDWPSFRAQETSILKDLIKTHSKGHIISLGGGVVEVEENRSMLQAYAKEGGRIVHIIRDIDDILDYLNSEPTRPSLGEPLRDIYARRLPWFSSLSNFEFVNVIPQSTSLKGCENEIARFFKFMTGADTNHADLDAQATYFLSLTFPTLTAPHPSLDQFDTLIAGVDALELRVDLLSPDNVAPTTPTLTSPAFVATQLAALRQRSTLPIVFTIRTKSQGGMFPDNAEDAVFELMELAVKSGCEYIDLEVRWNPKRMAAFVERKQNSRIIASWHDWTGRLKWDSEEMKQRYSMANQYGDIIKLVSKADSLFDNITLLKFREANKSGKLLMTMNMGAEGQLSRILSPVLGPLTSPLMPTRAAPGQLSFAEVQTGLHLLGRLPAKKFALLGSPIAHSKSPLLHNTGFETLGLPHAYSFLETPTIDASVQAFIRSPDFGGASVTIPHKLDIVPFLDEISPHAQAIGAVNTIIPVTKDGKTTLLGENTDWLGIKELVLNNLSTENEVSELSTALVLGAGGTSRAAIYCLHSVGFKTIYLFNRTRENAQKMVDTFPKNYNIVVLTSLDSFPFELPVAIISTIPATGTSTSHLPNPEAGVSIPSSIFGRAKGGVVIDMAYKPARTPLLDLVEKEGGANWKGVEGIRMLLEQGYHQFSLWTGRRAPKEIMERKVMAAF